MRFSILLLVLFCSCTTNSENLSAVLDQQSIVFLEKLEKKMSSYFKNEDFSNIQDSMYLSLENKLCIYNFFTDNERKKIIDSIPDKMFEIVYEIDSSVPYYSISNKNFYLDYKGKYYNFLLNSSERDMVGEYIKIHDGLRDPSNPIAFMTLLKNKVDSEDKRLMIIIEYLVFLNQVPCKQV